MNLYPYLPLSAARMMAEELATQSRAALLERSSDWDDGAIFPPIGGERVDRGEIRRLQGLVRARMLDAEASSEKASDAYQKFDEAAAPLLLREMNISPHEASQTGLWAFLACVVLPDVVRWRFPGDDTSGTSDRRFVGGTRGIRNAIGRLWWRAYVFGDPNIADPWQLVRTVGEDQSVQILERPFLSGNPALARAILRAAVGSASSRQQDVVRDLTKRLLRMGGVVPLEALPDDLLARAVTLELGHTLRALASPGTLLPAAEPVAKGAPREPIPSAEPIVAAPGSTPANEPDAETSAPPAIPEVRTAAGTIRTRALQARISRDQLEPGPMQGIMVVPDTVAEMLPALEESYANPERNLVAIDEEGHRWPWLYVHYNRSGSGRRLVGLTPYLLKRGAKPGDLVKLVIGSGGMIEVRVEHAAVDPATQ